VARRDLRRLLLSGGASAFRRGARRDEVGVAIEVQGPSGVVVDTVADTFPTGPVPFDVAMFEFESGALRGLGDEPDFDFAGVVGVGLDLPVRADVPADYDAVWRLERQDASPPTFAAISATVVDVAADVRLEHRRGDRDTEQVVLRWLEVPEPPGEHGKGLLDR
jgi:hypothetical protein